MKEGLKSFKLPHLKFRTIIWCVCAKQEHFGILFAHNTVFPYAQRNFTTALSSLNSVFLTLVYTALHSNTAKCSELSDGP